MKQYIKWILWILGGLFLIFVAIAVWTYFNSRFYKAIDSPFFSGGSYSLIIPVRPGTRGIVIDLPQENPMFFGIDVLRSEPVDWHYLYRLDPRTDVRIRGFIDLNGRLTIQNIIDVTHAGAGEYLRNILSTWKYTPLKTGEITFHFNLPSEGAKLIVYTHALYRNPTVDRKLPILPARLYHVEGIDPHLVLLRE